MPRFTTQKELEAFKTKAEVKKGQVVRSTVLQARKLAADMVLYISKVAE